MCPLRVQRENATAWGAARTPELERPQKSLRRPHSTLLPQAQQSAPEFPDVKSKLSSFPAAPQRGSEHHFVSSPVSSPWQLEPGLGLYSPSTEHQKGTTISLGTGHLLHKLKLGLNLKDWRMCHEKNGFTLRTSKRQTENLRENPVTRASGLLGQERAEEARRASLTHALLHPRAGPPCCRPAAPGPALQHLPNSG